MGKASTVATAADPLAPLREALSRVNLLRDIVTCDADTFKLALEFILQCGEWRRRFDATDGASPPAFVGILPFADSTHELRYSVIAVNFNRSRLVTASQRQICGGRLLQFQRRYVPALTRVGQSQWKAMNVAFAEDHLMFMAAVAAEAAEHPNRRKSADRRHSGGKKEATRAAGRPPRPPAAPAARTWLVPGAAAADAATTLITQRRAELQRQLDGSSAALRVSTPTVGSYDPTFGYSPALPPPALTAGAGAARDDGMPGSPGPRPHLTAGVAAGAVAADAERRAREVQLENTSLVADLRADLASALRRLATARGNLRTREDEITAPVRAELAKVLVERDEARRDRNAARAQRDDAIAVAHQERDAALARQKAAEDRLTEAKGIIQGLCIAAKTDVPEKWR